MKNTKIFKICSIFILLFIGNLLFPIKVSAVEVLITRNNITTNYSALKSLTSRFVITLDLAENKRNNHLTYEITFDDNPTGWLLNIGDSSTNNGYGGDSGTQSNDAELQIVNGTLSIYCNDYGSSRLLDSLPNCIQPNGKIRIEIANNVISYYNYQTGVYKIWTSPYLFALDGQTDKEGSTNFVIYTGINRVVANDSRQGIGIDNVHIIVN